MATRRRDAEPRQAEMTRDEMKRGIARIKKRIEDLERFDPTSISKRWAPEVEALQTAIDETLAAVFGHNTPQYIRYRRAADLDQGAVIAGRRESSQEVQRYVAEGKQEAIILLAQAVRGLEEEIADKETVLLPPAVEVEAEVQRDLSKVFVVHGHNGEVREAIARFISRIGFEPVILHERPNKGRTIITKFREEAAGVGFAVVLMAPDDLGKASDAPDLRPRARQNVVFELGFFIGAFRPEHVAAL